MQNGQANQSELCCDCRSALARLRLTERATEHRGHFDLDLLAQALYSKLRHRLPCPREIQCLRTGQRGLDGRSESTECRVDVSQTLVATFNRQVGQIDIHRQPRQVTDKKIDR